MAGKLQRIGLLGGTFNPIHLGHPLIAQDALEQPALDCVKFIPSPTPPHKTVEALASERDRVRIIRLAIVRATLNVADFFFICTGTSEPHLKAIADEISRRLRDEGIRPLHRDRHQIEGMPKVVEVPLGVVDKQTAVKKPLAIVAEAEEMRNLEQQTKNPKLNAWWDESFTSTSF